MEEIKIEAYKGERLTDFIERAIGVASTGDLEVEAVFNDISVIVYPKSCLADIKEKYALKVQVEYGDVPLVEIERG